ncbi:MAG: hypothetical protein WCF57_16830 [Pyrinomonadaceae bacterium]
MAFSIFVLRTAVSAPAPLVQSYSNITPTNLVGATSSGSTITATASNGNGRSTESIASGNGGVRYTNTQPSPGSPVRAGLQFGTWDGTAGDIDFRWKTYGDVVTADTTQTGGTVYTTSASIGDILEVRIVGTSVVWYINGTAVHTETGLTIGYPLKAAASIYASGDAVSTIQIDVGNTPPPPTRNYSNITPTNLVGATNTGPTITATASNGNGRSTESIPSGDGGVRYTNTQPSPGTPVRAGLQFGTWDGTAGDIDFRWKTYGDVVTADTTQTGGTVYTTSANIGDILEVRIVGTSVVWYINETPVHTETGLTIGYPIKAAASIYASGNSVSTIQIDVGTNLPLTAPSAVSVTATTTSSVTLGWTNNGGSRTGTRVYRKQLGTNGLSTSGTYSLITTTTSSAATYVDSGLSANQNYIFKVCSTDGSTELCASPLNGTTAYGGTVNNYKTDHTATTEPTLKKLPLKGGKWFDDSYGTEIMRVTDDTDWPTYGLGTQYSIWPSFNCNNTFLLARQGDNGGAYLIGWDATNFRRTTPTATLLPSATPTGRGIVWQDAFWSTVNPNLLYLHDAEQTTTQQIWEYNVSTLSFTSGSTPLHTFSLLSGQSASLYLQQLSDDSDIFMYNFRQSATAEAVVEYVVWKRSTNTVLRQQNLAALGLEATVDGNPMAGFNEVRIDKSGQYAWIILTVPQSNGQSGQRIQNIATGAIATFDRPPDHNFNINHGHQGNGFAVGEDASTPAFQIRRFSNFSKYVDIFMFTDSNGVKFWLGGAHGTMSSTNDEWITNSSYTDTVNGPTMPAFHNEIWQLANDGSGRVRRLVQHRSIFNSDNNTSDYVTNGYWGTPKQTISRDGKFIAFTSNWGNSGRTDLFVAKVTPAPTGLGITPRAQDTFNYYTSASSGIGTTIAGHAADIGGTWVLHPSYSSSSPVVSDYTTVSFAARGTATAHALTLLNTAVPVSDYKVMTICHRIGRVGTGNMRCGAAARFSNPTNTGLIASWKESGFIKLDQYVNGSATELGSYAVAVDDARVHQITLQVSGTTATVWVDGVARITATTSITGAGVAGFITGENTTDGVNGTYVRDFFVTSSD